MDKQTDARADGRVDNRLILLVDPREQIYYILQEKQVMMMMIKGACVMNTIGVEKLTHFILYYSSNYMYLIFDNSTSKYVTTTLCSLLLLLLLSPSSSSSFSYSFTPKVKSVCIFVAISFFAIHAYVCSSSLNLLITQLHSNHIVIQFVIIRRRVWYTIQATLFYKSLFLLVCQSKGKVWPKSGPTKKKI